METALIAVRKKREERKYIQNRFTGTFAYFALFADEKKPSGGGLVEYCQVSYCVKASNPAPAR